MNKSQTVSVGIFFILGLALIFTVFEQLSDESIKKSEGYEIIGTFETLLQLRVDDDVRMAGVRIGSVQKTGLEGRTPTAVFKIDKEFQIPSDSVATIGMAGLLGNNMVSIQMGSESAALAPGGEIPTAIGFDVNYVVNEIGSLSQQIGGALDNFQQILGSTEGEDGIFRSIGNMIRENEASLKSTLANLDSITTQIAAGEGTIGQLLMKDEIYNDLKTLSAQLEKTLTEGEALLTDTRDIVAHVKQGEGTLGGLIYGETDLAQEVELLLADLREFSSNLNNPDSTIGKLLNDDEMYGELQGIVRKANQTLDSLGDSAPISAVGAVASPLF